MKKKGPDGKDVPVEVGDRVSYRIEIYDRDPAPGRLPGKSEEFTRELQTVEEFNKRLTDTLSNESKIRDLEKKQQGIFSRPKP